jgi:hypothetical protein
MRHRYPSLKHLIFVALMLFLAAGKLPATSARHPNPADDHSLDPAADFLLRHSAEPSAGRMGETPAFADFDGDQKADMAIARLVKDQYQIVVSLSRRSEAAVLNPSVRLAGFIIHAFDINNDSYQDVVVTDAIAKYPLAVWLGDGRGNFEIANQNLFRNYFDFTEPSKYRSTRLSPDQDLFEETPGPSIGKTTPLMAIPELKRAGHIIPWANFRTLRRAYRTIAPRSPPASHS